MSGPPAAPTSSERSYKTRFTVILSLFVGFGFLAGIPATILSHNLHSVGKLLVSLLLGAVAYVGIWRGGRVDVVAGPTGVLIRNTWKTRRLPWEAIKEFGLASHFLMTIGWAVLVDGTRQTIDGIQGYKLSFSEDSWPQHQIDELNRLLRAHTPSRPNQDEAQP